MAPLLVAAADAAALGVGVQVLPFDSVERAAIVAVGLGLLALVGSYRSRLALSALDDLPRLVRVTVLLSLAVVLVPTVGADAGTSLTVLTVVSACLVIGRTLVYALVRRLRRTPTLSRRAVIVGAGAVGRDVHAVLGDHPEYGITSAGVVDDVGPEEGLPLLGRVSEIGDVLDRTGADVVVVAFGLTGEQELVPVLRAVQNRSVDLLIVPRFFELGLAPSGPEVETIWGIPLYRVRRAALSRWNWPVKRTMDVLAATVLLVLLSPLMLALTAAVRFSSPGPILFRQRRIGQHGQPIEVLKFRTMRVNDDSDTKWTVVEDPRITPIGRWLRRLSLDELPQLLNVLRGDMSMVGPRPERPHFVDRFSLEVRSYPDRHRVPAGLTGLAQIHGLRGDTSISDRARFDNAYVEHWTTWLDIKIVLRTISAVVRDALQRDAQPPGADTTPEPQAPGRSAAHSAPPSNVGRRVAGEKRFAPVDG